MEKPQVIGHQEAKSKRRKRPIGSPPLRKTKTRYVWLNVLPYDLTLKAREGETVWEVIQKENIELNGECGGLGKCGKCKVKVLSSIGPPSTIEEELLQEDELEQGIRLACRTVVDNDLTIHTDHSEDDVEYFQILQVGHRPLLHPSPLVEKRLVTLPPEVQDEELSDFDRIKMVLVPEYKDLKAPLSFLRKLPSILTQTAFSGTAVLHENRLLAWQEPQEINCYYGLVFDIGTCTLVGKLINLTDGTEISAVSCLNSQMRYGTNVISRLKYIKDHSNGLENLHNMLVKDLNRITARLLNTAELEPEDVFIAVAAGNTTMQHLLLTLEPSGIAEAPFLPIISDGVVVQAADAGLKLHPEALLYVMPIKSGYIGGDLISVILASGASEQEDEIILGLDLGTNGEIFLGNRKKMMTCSTAAGPALEGAAISHGMIAKSGAIEGVFLEDSELHFQIIGNIKPKGLCGSGLVDLMAVLLHSGIIDHEGLIHRPRRRAPESLRSKVIKRGGVHEFIIASPEESYKQRPIYLTQRDVRELQLAKGAIAAGIRILMDEMKIGVDEIDRVCLAGALGNYVDPLSAIRIGLIPQLDIARITSLGNAASMGASMVLLSKDYWQMANELSHSIEHIELSSQLDFDQYFVEQMNFPRENIW